MIFFFGGGGGCKTFNCLEQDKQIPGGFLKIRSAAGLVHEQAKRDNQTTVKRRNKVKKRKKRTGPR